MRALRITYINYINVVLLQLYIIMGAWCVVANYCDVN